MSVVVVNYDSGHYLVDCVRSLLNSTYREMELTVVDNASKDDSLARMQRLYPEVKVVRNPVNVGYSRACNIAIGRACSEFLVVMNSDILVEPGWLESLLDATRRHPAAAFFQPKILMMDNPHILNSAGNMIHVAGFGVCRGIGRSDSEAFQNESEVCYTSGACTLARVKALNAIGPMEELFWMYGEDKDWGWRALMMGWKSVYVPSSRVLHKWSPAFGKSPRKFYLLEFERLLSIWKNYSKRTLILLAPVLLLVEVSVLVYAAVRGWLSEKLRSYVELFRLRLVLAEKRGTIQRGRIVPDRLLVSRFVVTMEHPYMGSWRAVFNRLVVPIFRCVRGSI